MDSWLRTFGDGATSTDRSPVHLYATPGTYSVSLTVANSGGSDTAVMKNFIKVNEKKQGTHEASATKEKPKIKLS